MRDQTPHPVDGVQPHTSGHQSVAPSHTSHQPSSPPTPVGTEYAPTPDSPPTPPGGFPSFPEAAPHSVLRVVVADDNPVVRAGLSVLLSGRRDIDVVAEAADGRQAYEAAVRHRPDVILLDVRMPGVDGISALPHLVRVAPVMMLTYSRENEIVHEALRLGAGGYLVHGEFTADQLVGAIRDVKEGRAHFTATAANALLAHMRGGNTPGFVPQSLPEGLGNAGTLRRDGLTREPSAADPTSPSLPPNPRSSVTNSFYQPPVASHLQVDMAQSSSGQEWGSSAPQGTAATGVPSGRNRAEYGLSSREVEVMELIASGMTNQQIAATCFISEKTVKNHINRIFAKLHSNSRAEAVSIWLGARRGDAGRGVTGRG
ncbi:response regulator transcription factor [Streptomyces hundungensis]|uniref:response regulator transcription factor n=1 Tax=Streptomyces hundungensis TaxID=1077946 RepID=UPI003405D8F4